jgi:hypothetical protein
MHNTAATTMACQQTRSRWVCCLRRTFAIGKFGERVDLDQRAVQLDEQGVKAQKLFCGLLLGSTSEAHQPGHFYRLWLGDAWSREPQ